VRLLGEQRAAFAQVAMWSQMRPGQERERAVKWEDLWNRLLKMSTVRHEGSQQVGLFHFISRNAIMLGLGWKPADRTQILYASLPSSTALSDFGPLLFRRHDNIHTRPENIHQLELPRHIHKNSRIALTLQLISQVVYHPWPDGPILVFLPILPGGIQSTFQRHPKRESCLRRHRYTPHGAAVRMKFRTRRRPRAIDTEIEADYDLPTRRNGDVTGEKTGVSVDGLVLSDHTHVLVVRALAPVGPLDALRSIWRGGIDFEERVEGHGRYQFCVKVPVVVVDDELEGRFAVYLNDGPGLRRCVRENDEHVLLQFC
jgi:hypothetical protein